MTCEQITVAGVQISQGMGSLQANISTAIQAITKAPGHDIYVLPELSSSGYGQKIFSSLEDLAEDIMGPSFKAFSDLAKRQSCFICYSFPRRAGNQKFMITTSVVDQNGNLVASYDKWHVCSIGECCEKDYFSAGNSPLAALRLKAYGSPGHLL